MTVSYKLLKSKGSVARNAKMRVVVDAYDTAEMDRMGQHIEKASSLTSADLTAALDALRSEMVDQLGSGYRVHLPGLGYFSLAVKGEVCEDPKTGHFRLCNPHVRTVKFRPEKDLLKALHGIDFENATYRRTPYAAPQPAEVAAALDQLFAASAFILVRDLRAALHLSRPVAYRLVQALEAAGKVRNVGTSRQKILVKGEG